MCVISANPELTTHTYSINNLGFSYCFNFLGKSPKAIVFLPRLTPIITNSHTNAVTETGCGNCYINIHLHNTQIHAHAHTHTHLLPFKKCRQTDGILLWLSPLPSPGGGFTGDRGRRSLLDLDLLEWDSLS